MLSRQSAKIFSLGRNKKDAQQYELLDAREHHDDVV